MALLALMAEWGRTDLGVLGYQGRVQHLFGTAAGGLNGAYLLNPATVSRDSAIDQLFGDPGLNPDDWYWYSASAKAVSKIKNYSDGEVATFE